jgi:hypothetical protein
MIVRHEQVDSEHALKSIVICLRPQ